MTNRRRARSASSWVKSWSVVPKKRLPSSSQTTVSPPRRSSTASSSGSRFWRENTWSPYVLRWMTLPRICSRMNSRIASATPVPDAAMRSTNTATAITAATTAKSSTVERWRSRRKLPRSNIR